MSDNVDTFAAVVVGRCPRCRVELIECPACEREHHRLANPCEGRRR